jgi:dTDP-glucose 4,6-dehydratase
MISYVKDRPGHDRRYAIDSTKIQRELGWRPSHNFDSGIDSTIAWYKGNRWWWEKLKKAHQMAQSAK